MKASELIHEARDYHDGFHPHAVPDVMLLRRLAATERRVVQEVTKLDSAALALPIVIDQETILESLDAGEGIEIPALIALTDVKVRAEGSTALTSVTLVSPSDRRSPRYWPSAWVAGRRLFLIDRRDFGGDVHGWETATELVVLAAVVPPALEDDDSELTLPVSARSALVLDLVRFMAGRVTAAQRDIPGEIAAAEPALAELIGLYAFGTAPMGWYVQ
jgi:hypothetical protein